MISFYTLNSSILNNDKHKTLRVRLLFRCHCEWLLLLCAIDAHLVQPYLLFACLQAAYSFYNVCSDPKNHEKLAALMEDALICAKLVCVRFVTLASCL